MLKNNADVLIVGAGSSGMLLACSLAQTTDLRIYIVDKLAMADLSTPPIDGRDIAVNYNSQSILENLGIWQNIEPESISTIERAKVVDGKSAYSLHFDNHKSNHHGLGVLVANFVLRQAIYNKMVSLPNVKLIAAASVLDIQVKSNKSVVSLSTGEQVATYLVVAADGRFSKTRTSLGITASLQDLGWTTIVCNMTHERAHNAIAYECFHYGSTLAVLPLRGNKSSIIITLPTYESGQVLAKNNVDFNYYVEQKFAHRLGRMQLVGECYSYPLVMVWAHRFISKRLALLGDAAVGMHPVTAHGFNFGVSGQNVLASLITVARGQNQDIGCVGVLARYQFKQRLATKPLYVMTNMLVKLYTSQSILPKIGRKLLLRLGNKITFMKEAVVSRLTAIKF